MGGLVAGLMLNAPVEAVLGVTLFLSLMPFAGALGLALWHARRLRRGKRLALAVLQLPPRRTWVTHLLVWIPSAALGIGIYIAMQLAQEQDLVWPAAVVLLLGGLVLPVIRRIQDPGLPGWAMALMTGWVALSVVLMLGVAQAVPAQFAVIAGLGLAMLLSPFGLPVVLLRDPITRAAGQLSLVGRLAARLVVFLPPAQKARHAGRTDDAMEALLERIPLLYGQVLGEALVELGQMLLDRRDPRAEGVFVAAAEILPGGAGPFAGLARSVRDSRPEWARLYVVFAESNAARGLGSVDPELVALRESILNGTGA